jgi:hypothetical protein
MRLTEQQYQEMEQRLAKGRQKGSKTLLAAPPAIFPPITSPKRIRQGEKPPTKLEADWRAHMEAIQPGVKFRAQAIRFRLANGAWYKPDLMAWLNYRVVCWETKGPKQAKNVARGILTIKVAAALWPEVLFILVWRDANGWHQQGVLP